MTRSSPTQTAVEPPHLGGSARFFAWLRSLDLVRHDGWIGGVRGAIATRAGIDPIIVRGLFVVGAVLGLPMLLVYGVLWALLPDERGDIQAENMLRGRFDPPLVAALVIIALGFVPVVPWLSDLVLFPLADSLSPSYYSLLYVVSTVSTLAFIVLAGIVAVALLRSLVRSRRKRAGARDALGAPATGPVMPAPTFDASLSGADGISPPHGAGPAYDEWRRQHQAWLAQHEAWRGAQPDADRIARAQALAERRELRARRNLEAAVAAEARRRANPRTNIGYVVLVLGLATAMAAGTAILIAPYGVPISLAAALFAAALVAAVGMVIAGILRRRSGFLTAVAVFTLLGGLGTAVYAAPYALVPGKEAATTQLSPAGGTVFLGSGNDYVQLRGLTWIQPANSTGTAAVTVTKGRGDTYITVPSDAAVHLIARLREGDVVIERWDSSATSDTTTVAPPSTVSGRGNPDGTQTYDLHFAGLATTSAPTTVFAVDLTQLAGDVYIELYEDTTR